MKRLEVSGAVRPLYGSLGVKGLMNEDAICWINPLTPNDPYRGRTAPLTSKVAFYIFIQQI